MPVREFKRELPLEYGTLVDGVVAEWRSPQSTNSEPVILTERRRDGKIEHVYVIWSKWDKIERVQRSEAVMDAVEKVLLADEVLNVTIAMGLTPDEADRLGLKWR